MNDWRCQLDVAHAFSANLLACDFYTTALADNPFEADALVFSARAFPVFSGTENLFTEQSVLFRFQGSVVDRFGFLDFPVGPGADGIGSCEADPYI